MDFPAAEVANERAVHAAAVRFTGLSDPMFQGTCLIGVVFVWPTGGTALGG
jgi:hypothetical protein